MGNMACPSPSGLLTAPQAHQAHSCLVLGPGPSLFWLMLPLKSPENSSSSSAHFCCSVIFSLSRTLTILFIAAERPAWHMPPATPSLCFSQGRQYPHVGAQGFSDLSCIRITWRAC